MRAPHQDHSGYDVFHAVHELCLEREPEVRMPPDTPVYVAELFATLGATIKVDPSMRSFRMHRMSR